MTTERPGEAAGGPRAAFGGPQVSYGCCHSVRVTPTICAASLIVTPRMSPPSLSGSDDEDMIVVTKYDDANIFGVIFRVPKGSDVSQRSVVIASDAQSDNARHIHRMATLISPLLFK